MVTILYFFVSPCSSDRISGAFLEQDDGVIEIEDWPMVRKKSAVVERCKGQMCHRDKTEESGISCGLAP